MFKTLLDIICEWANQDDNIRALALVGSRTRQELNDEWSDYDVELYVRDATHLLNSDLWIHDISTVWVYIPEKYPWDEKTIPTRLVIYEQGQKVDYSFFSPNDLSKRIKTIPHMQVLINKDQLVVSSDQPQFSIRKRPTPEHFEQAVQNFFYEVHYVARYLARGELWQAKTLEQSVKSFFLPMIEWHTWTNYPGRETYHAGRKITDWADPSIIDTLPMCFSRYDLKTSWDALFQTLALFREIAQSTAHIWGYEYPHLLDNRMSQFVQSAYNKSSNDW